MKIVIAPDSFKGSASSRDIATWIESGIHSVIPDCETVRIAIGDGEEGSGIDDFAADNGIDCDGTGVAKLAICLLLL